MKKFKCMKCKGTKCDEGVIKMGPVSRLHTIGYRSDKHYPYADHVGQQRVVVCTKCGFAEVYFDVQDLERKLKK